VEASHLVLISVLDITALFHQELHTFLVHDLCVANIVHQNGGLSLTLLSKVNIHASKGSQSSLSALGVLSGNDCGCVLLVSFRFDINALIFNQHVYNIHVYIRGKVKVMMKDGPLLLIFGILKAHTFLLVRLELVVVVLVDVSHHTAKQIGVKCVYHFCVF